MSFSRRKKFSKFGPEGVEVSYQEVDNLRSYVSENGRMVPSRITGADAHTQRQISSQVKIARYLALLPYCDTHKA